MRVTGLALKLVMGALPMREFAAMRSAFRDPDAIGAFADPIFVQPRGEFDSRGAAADTAWRFSCSISVCCLVS